MGRRDKDKKELPDWLKQESWLEKETRERREKGIEVERERQRVQELVPVARQKTVVDERALAAVNEVDAPKEKLKGLVNAIADAGWTTESIRQKVKAWLGRPDIYSWLYNRYRSVEGMETLGESLTNLNVGPKHRDAIINIVSEELLGKVR